MASRPDSSAIAALDQPVIRPHTVGFLDILGDPIRVTTAPYSITFEGTGDADLDGHTFLAVDPRFISVSAVRSKEGGGDTVSCTLSGLAGVDDELMTRIGDKANWQGRDARLWRMMFDENLQRIGNIWCYFTGYMTVPKVVGDRSAQTIILDIETYLAFLMQASNRSWLDQARYDSGDLSAEASIAVANGTSAAALTGGGGGIAAAMAAGGMAGRMAARL